MIFDIRGRAGGKTTAVVALAKKNPDLRVVVPTCAQADLLIKAGLAKAQVLTPTSRETAGRRGGLIIDNVDWLIQDMFPGLPVEYVTATGVLL